MDLGHAHLYLNHFPIIGSVIFSIFIIYSIAKKRDDLLRITLWAIVFLAIVLVPVFLTGEPAEELAFTVPGITEETVEPHESSALITLIIMEILGITSFISLIIFKKGKIIASWISYIIAVLTIVFIASAVITANLGGEIRHTEIRSNSSVTD